MVDRAKLQERLMATFVDELAEHVESINECVLELESVTESAAREATLAKLFRAPHSVKGASRAVDVPPIEHVCHKLEDVFTAIRDETLKLSPNVASVILSVADAIGTAGNLMRDREPIAEDHFGKLPEQLAGVASGEVHVGETQPAAANPAESVAANVSKLPAVPVPEESAALAENDSADNPAAKTADSKPPTQTSRRSRGGTVRVAEEKLDSLMAQAGELLVARQRLEIRPEEVESLANELTHCRNEYQNIERTLSEILEASVIASHTSGEASGFRVESTTANGSILAATPITLPQGMAASRLLHVVGQTGSRLRQMEQRLEDLHRHLLSDVRQLNHTGEALQQDIHRIRMLPFSDGCAGLERAMRDVATATGKQARLSIEGGDIEVDRTVLEGLRDPLLHLVRNAVDHGLETPDERTEQGKSEIGHVNISASLRGSQVEITISDDGRGLNREAILRKRQDKGLADPQDDQDLIRSIFLPGFSTAKMITDVSGRGVGMDVVRSQLESLHGTIDLSSQPGLGSRFSLSLPLTLTTISALFVRTGDDVFAIPNTNVSRLVRFRANELKTMGGQSVLLNENTPIPVTTLSAMLNMPADLIAVEDTHLLAVVLTTGDRDVAVIVDELLGERDAVVKSLGPQIRRVRNVSGATLLRSGRIALLLNATTLVRDAAAVRDVALQERKPSRVEVVSHRIMVVDDSITTRSLLRNILEAAGYDVTPAVDGQDAWTQLQAGKFDIVVTDVDMPNLDGFGLTERIRQTESMVGLPVVLVTSRDSDADKARGVQVGADAYLVKSSFEQSDILDVVEQLL